MYKVMAQPLQGRVKGKFVYCRCEGEYSQRHLLESRAGRESSTPDMASRPKLAMRGEGEGRERNRREEDRERAKVRGPREHMAETSRLYKDEKLREGSP